MIGAVFCLANTGVQTLVLEFLRIFIVSAFFCLILAFVCIYYLTKRMVTPLHQMSNAAKQFSVGDFMHWKAQGEALFPMFLTSLKHL